MSISYSHFEVHSSQNRETSTRGGDNNLSISYVYMYLLQGSSVIIVHDLTIIIY